LVAKEWLTEIVDTVIDTRETRGPCNQMDIYNRWSNQCYHEVLELKQVTWILDFIKDLCSANLTLLKQAALLDRQ
jgi:hypothetical protein